MDPGIASPSETIEVILLTAAATTVVALLVRRYLAPILDWLSRPFRYLSSKAWDWLAPRNPLSLAVRSYRKHVLASHLGRIEIPVGPIDSLPLHRTTTVLRLFSLADKDRLDILALAARFKRVVIVGGPGSGKTTLMKYLVTSTIRRQPPEALGESLPVFISLRDLTDPGLTVETLIVNSFAYYHFPGAESYVRSALKHGRLLIVLDGLDEVGSARHLVVRQIKRFCREDDLRATPNRVLVTCRENSYRSEDLRDVIPAVARIEPLTNHQMRAMLAAWPAFKGRLPSELYLQLSANAHVQDACRSPLLLSILVGLYLEEDAFRMPRSRDRFFLAALDELLENRPARKGLEQKYQKEDKLRVLQCVALESMEISAEAKDFEAFSRESILSKISEIVSGSTDPRTFLDELVHINGIIKPTLGDAFTCAHRTIQEFLAAREAVRTMQPEEVLDRLGNRPEHLQVILFHSALLDNTQQMGKVIDFFGRNGKWLVAAECLINMKEPPALLISEVSENLAEAALGKRAKGREVGKALELLASLGQGKAPIRATPRRLFTRTIRELADRSAEGALTVGASLAGNPAAAVKLAPILIEEKSGEWQLVGIRLLHELGTEEALDQLVKLLEHRDDEIRKEAALVIARLLPERGEEFAERAALLQEKSHAVTWPIDGIFPARLALAIIEACRGLEETGNRAIDAGLIAAEIMAQQNEAGFEFIRTWHSLPKALALRERRRRLGKVCIIGGFSLALVLLGVGFSTIVWGAATDHLLVWSRSEGWEVGTKSAFAELKGSVADLESELKRSYPPKVKRFARLLPQNWSVEAEVPAPAQPAHARVMECGKRWVEADMLPDLEDFRELRKLDVAPIFVNRVESALETLPGRYVLSKEDVRLMLPDPGIRFIHFLMLLVLVGGLLLGTYQKRSWDDTERAMDKRFGPYQHRSKIYAFSTLPFLLPQMARGDTVLVLGPLFIVACLIIFGVMTYNLEWPRNPFRDVLSDLGTSIGTRLLMGSSRTDRVAKELVDTKKG